VAGGPARNAFKVIRGKPNNLIYNPMVTLTQSTMHGRRACPRCRDSGVSTIQTFELSTDVSTKQLRYAWQAGVGSSFFELISHSPIFFFKIRDPQSKI
jgi:hypothetical protein